MNFDQMLSQARPTAVGVRAVLALVAFYSGVHFHVPADTFSVVEQSTTNLALKMTAKNTRGLTQDFKNK